MTRTAALRRLALLTGSAALVSSLLGLVMVSTVLGTYRTQNPTSPCAVAAFRAFVFEDQNLSGDALWTCASITNLDAVSHTLSGDCKSPVFRLSDTWNDCISSVQWWIPSGRRLQIWSESGYRGALFEVSTCNRGSWNGSANIPVPPGDYASSIRFLTCS